MSRKLENNLESFVIEDSIRILEESHTFFWNDAKSLLQETYTDFERVYTQTQGFFKEISGLLSAKGKFQKKIKILEHHLYRGCPTRHPFASTDELIMDASISPYMRVFREIYRVWIANHTHVFVKAVGSEMAVYGVSPRNSLYIGECLKRVESLCPLEKYVISCQDKDSSVVRIRDKSKQLK